MTETTTQTRYNGWANYETWVLKLWQDNEQHSQEYWLEVAENAESKGTLADQMQSEYEEAMPEVTGLWADLLSAALGTVDWFEIAEHLLEEVKENKRYEATKMMEAGATSSDSCKPDDIVAGIADLLPEKLLEEFKEADEDDQPDIFEEICEYLDEIAPEGTHFGTQEGDGASYGFWKDDDAESKEA